MVREMEVLTSFQGQPGFEKILFACPESLCLVKEFSGPTLDDCLRRNSLSTAQRLDVLRQTVRILNHMHIRGLLYLDTDPKNICVTLHSNKDVTVTVTGCRGSVPVGGRLAVVEGNVVGDGAVRSLMAPEVLGGMPLDLSADAYAVSRMARLLGLTHPAVLTEEALQWMRQSSSPISGQRGTLRHLSTLLPYSPVMRPAH